VVAQSERTAPGGEHITLTASKPSPTDTVVWSLDAGSPGSLDRTSGDTVQYIPPAAGNPSGSAAVVVNASIGSATKKTTIFLEGAQGLRLLAGNDFGWGAVNASGQAARFRVGAGIARDAQGNVYVADSGNGVIRKVTAQGEVMTFAGSVSARGSVDGTGTAARFYWPTGITIDAAGNLFVTDETNNNIRKITPSGIVTTVAGDASLPGGPGGSNDGTGMAAKFNRPSGIAVDLAGNLYVSDTGNQMIRKITPAGVVTTLAANNPSVPVESRLLSGPRGLAVDVSGNVYVVDSAADGEVPCGPNCYNAAAAVRKITPQGVVTTFAGKHGVMKISYRDGKGFVDNPDAVARDGVGTEARFEGPMNGIAIDATGNLYVNTSGPVRKITQEGIVSTLPNKNGGSHGRDWLALDPAGKLYIADTQLGTEYRILEMSFNGDIVTLAGGTIRTDGYRDGSGRSALFQQPAGIASDRSGNLYVVDERNPAVRKITPLGEVSTLLKLPSTTRLYAITTDASGNIYVYSDSMQDGWAIRKISPSGEVNVLPNTTGSVMTPGGYLYSAEYLSNVNRKIGGTINFGMYAPGIATDSTGNLYLLSSYLSSGVSVYKVTQAGATSAVMTVPAGFSVVGMTIDQEDNLYVTYSNYGETVIRKITPQGTASTVFSYTGDGVSDGNHLTPNASMWMAGGIAMAGAKTIALTVDNGVFLLQLP
jgi:sugar lactone lactonase YvrE